MKHRFAVAAVFLVEDNVCFDHLRWTLHLAQEQGLVDTESQAADKNGSLHIAAMFLKLHDWNAHRVDYDGQFA